MIDKKTIARIIKKYGPVIDLRTNPEVLIDIIRGINFQDDGGLPGGVPEPPPPPGPTSFQDRVTNEDIMRTLLQLSRQVKALQAAAKVTKATKVAKVAKVAVRKKR